MDLEKGKILIVDDDQGVLHSAKMFLKQIFEEVETIDNPLVMLFMIKKESYDVVLLDMNFTKGEIDGSEGINLLQEILKLDPDLPVIFITAYGDFDLAVNAIKAGAYDFIVKPWKNQKLHATILSALKFRNSKIDLSKYKETTDRLEVDNESNYKDFIYESLAMQRVNDLIKRVAITDADVLITGENGTGKEMIARQIYQNSNRKNSIFLKVDVGSIHENLFESELFGHEKGSFTDAKEKKTGRFELASGGTLFIDEIGNIDVKLQAKLLSVLQNREMIRVGGTKTIPINIRLICATNQNLSEMVKQGKFREDLYYRINMFELGIPALRDRVDDIPSLTRYYLEKFKTKYQKKNIKISDLTIEKLKRYNWPGNIRELKNSIERAIILESKKQLTAESIFPSNQLIAKSNSVQTFNLEENEKQLILKAIQKNLGNMTKTAGDLGLERTALYRRMKKYGL
ncbi:MAG: sigma-54-dependent Fis family transcriptional regulator [Bacteroidales bacterium]|nr:sigma-54-dependent Fis family transcriptional regulator [Bacteroidales bacterium]